MMNINENCEKGKPESIRLVEERGATSIFINAEITEGGDLQIFGQDVGAAPMEFWGDLDYEYWVTVPAAWKDSVFRVLTERLYGGNRRTDDELNHLLNSKQKDVDLLILIKRLYGGNDRAVSEFKRLMESNGIPCEFSCWM